MQSGVHQVNDPLVLHALEKPTKPEVQLSVCVVINVFQHMRLLQLS